MAKWEKCKQCKGLYKNLEHSICVHCDETNSLKSKVNETVYYWSNYNVHKATLLKVNDNSQILISKPNGTWLIKNTKEIITKEQFEDKGLARYLL